MSCRPQLTSSTSASSVGNRSRRYAPPTAEGRGRVVISHVAKGGQGRRRKCSQQPRLLADELDIRFLDGVAPAGDELQDARVAAGTLGERRGDLVHELALDGAVVDLTGEQATSVKVAATGRGDQLLDIWLQVLGLGQRGLDAAVAQERGRLAARQRGPVAA